MAKAIFKLSIDTSELDETVTKIERLNKLLEEANSLINELASREVEITASVKTLQDSK